MRFSLGMSTPARRAIAIPSLVAVGPCTRSPGYPARAYVPVVQCRSLAGSTVRECLILLSAAENLLSALTLLVARVDGITMTQP